MSSSMSRHRFVLVFGFGFGPWVLGLLALLASALMSCHRRDPAPTSTADSTASADPAVSAASAALVVDRPYTLRVPGAFDRKTPAPLVVLLHGYGNDARGAEAYFGLRALVDTKGLLLAVPRGTVDARGDRFWNAGDACCNLFGAKVDDVAYLHAVLDDVARKYAVDRKRVYVVGHSNGGFMAERLACEMASRIAAIVDLAGAASSEIARCTTTEPVASLHVHGDLDSVIRTTGGRLFDQPSLPIYPSLADTMGAWGTRNGCTGALAPTGKRLDLDGRIAGAETRVERFASCARADVELWSVEGGSHSPAFLPAFAERIYDFLAAHPKP